ncbi:MAG: undecaprenyl-diphosphate phosphatase, partial [Bacteroidales bacterium]
IQGLTEFLPVSSSGHLELARSIFSLKTESSFYFTIAVHGATVLSTIVVFREELIKLGKGALLFRMNPETSYILKIFLSMIPVGITGLLLKNQVEEMFTGNLVLVGSMLLVTSLLLLAGHLVKNKGKEIGYSSAFIIGIAQAIAVIPGISRSGATISTGLIIGTRKDEIARFSFLMVLLPVIGANLIETVMGDMTKNSADTAAIITGFLAAFLTGYLACRWMINLVRKSKMIWFSIYCALVGAISIIAG